MGSALYKIKCEDERSLRSSLLAPVFHETDSDAPLFVSYPPSSIFPHNNHGKNMCQFVNGFFGDRRARPSSHHIRNSFCRLIEMQCHPHPLSPTRALLGPFLRCPLFFFDGAFTLAGGAKSNDGNVNGTVSDRSQPFTPNEFPSLFSPAIFPALSPPSSPRARF